MLLVGGSMGRKSNGPQKPEQWSGGLKAKAFSSMFSCLLKPHVQNNQLTIIEGGKYTKCKNWWVYEGHETKEKLSMSLIKKKKNTA